MQDSKEKQCLIFVRNNANDTADRIEAYAKKSGMEVVETVFNTDKKAVERLRYYIERDAIICVLVRDVVDISMELNRSTAFLSVLKTVSTTSMPDFFAYASIRSAVSFALFLTNIRHCFSLESCILPPICRP